MQSTTCSELGLSQMLHSCHGPLMDMDDLAGTLKIKRESLYQRIYYGKLVIPHMKNGKKYLFKTEDVAEYIQSEFERSTSLSTH
jgi:predicted site-specific integrase-resolvase